jgi:polysaccharide export outer membrane protein
MRRKLFAAAFLAAVCLTGIAPAQTLTNGVGTNIVADTVLAEARARTSAKTYVLAANDMISVEVIQPDDFKAERRVAEDGTVFLPLIENIIVGGLTLEQSRQLVREKLAKDFIINPQVTVTLTHPRPKKFTILGEVQRPAQYEFTGVDHLTLVEAIAIGGGKTGKGSLSKVLVLRIIDGKAVTYKLDAEAMIRKEGARQFEILPGDIIKVGETIL